jgi:hypothetical protein
MTADTESVPCITAILQCYPQHLVVYPGVSISPHQILEAFMVPSLCPLLLHRTKSDRHPGRECPDNRRSHRPVACNSSNLQVAARHAPGLHPHLLGTTATLNYTSLRQSDHVVYSMLPSLYHKSRHCQELRAIS